MATSDIRYGTDGVARFADLVPRSAPRLVVTSSRAAAPGGQLQLVARANSVDYGPLSMRHDQRPARDAGRPNAPARHRPTTGGAVDGRLNGYRLAAKGETDYGLLTADVVLLTAAGPLTIDVERADLSGSAQGRLQQSAAGALRRPARRIGAGLAIVRPSRRLPTTKWSRRISAREQCRAAYVARLAVGSAIVDADTRSLYDKPCVIIADIQLADTRIRDYDI